ncbi:MULTISPECIES: GPW/gp25 family protein [unclassified Microcoleus]|uniref:GPW/gp25 family protein n=1 Tax=unclassified Microcoleus TaxID=2642155 RepID=UPI002FD5C9B9
MVNLANRQLRRPYLGQSLRFPLQVNPQGSIDLSAEEQNIRESIYIILLTQWGERVYRPNFGCRLSELMFAPINSQTLMLMRIYVQEALEVWEPRIIVDEVLADPDPTQGRVDLIINYRLQTSYESRSIIFPFYLQPEPEFGNG